ncbi:MAG TPA: hypothetical protein VGR90_09955 [Acidimicrobiales bacterium]|nr:hypothetical protein [Acidimicrobiales bacterium]
MVDLGPRLTGNTAHRQWIDEIEADFQSLGMTTSRDHYTFTRWEAESWGLEVLEGSAAGPKPVSSYFPYSGGTHPAGLDAPLVYIGPAPLPSISGNPLDLYTNRWALERWRAELATDVRSSAAAIPGGVAGRIVLMDATVPPLMAEDFYPFVTYADPKIQITHDYKRIWIVGAYIQNILTELVSLGAAGAVFAMDASAANAAGQYTPYALPVFGIPALYVDRDTGTSLRAAAGSTPKTRLTLVSHTNQKAPTDDLVAIMPGDGSTDEVMVLNTHTDGQNAFEENGGVALRMAAHYFHALGPAARKRTLVFNLFSGHFGDGSLPQAQGFVNQHPDLVARAAASFTAEHFGATEWLDDARGYYPTGKAAFGSCWHSQTPIAIPLVETMRAEKLSQQVAIRPIGDFMIAVGGPLHKAGIPTLSYITGPNYLVSIERDGHLDKLDPVFYRTEVIWMLDTIQRLDKIPAAVLKAGDTEVWANDGGALKNYP